MAKNIDLLLINPGNRKTTHGVLKDKFSGIEPPVLLGLIAAFARENGFSVEIIDADAEELSPEKIAERVKSIQPILVGIVVLGANPSASSTPKMPATRDILNILKKEKLGVKTVMCGIHPSALPEQTLHQENIDFVSKGESFYTIVNLLKALKTSNSSELQDIKGLWYIDNGKLIANGWGKLVENLDELPFVAWDLLPMEKYRAHNWHCFGNINQRGHYTSIYTSMGCPFKCNYCNIHALYNGEPRLRLRSVKNIINEIDYLVLKYSIKNLKILDELFVFHKKRAHEICDLLIERDYKLNIWAYARIDTVEEELLTKLKKAGVNWISFGIETGNEGIRKEALKNGFNKDLIIRAIKMTKKAGIYVMGNFMFGFSSDNLETMQETLNLAKKLNCEYVNFYTTMAYPGSSLYEEMLQNGIALPQDWIKYSQFGYETEPLPTKYLSSKDVLYFRDNAFTFYLSDEHYLQTIKEKFGIDTVKHIKNMLKHKLRRKIFES